MKKSFLLLFIAIISLSSCDAIRGALGMPTSEDIKRAKVAIAEKAKEAEKKRLDSIATVKEQTEAAKRDSIAAATIQDSIDTAILDSIAMVESQSKLQQTTSAQLTNRFYLIAGNFSKDRNIQNMLNLLSSKDFQPIIIPLKNGNKMVAVAGFDSSSAAYSKIKELSEWDESPKGMWVYDTKTKLHTDL